MREPTLLSPLAFFGTPEFALPTLEALAAAGRTPAVVVSQPARRAGRGRRPVQPPVAEWALARGLPLLQPERVRAPAFQAELARWAPALAVVVAFGQIFPRPLLALPTHGCLNLHASLLPAYRGAAPIAAAIAAGDEHTGVSTMLMEAGLDSGPVLLQRAEVIDPRDTGGALGARLSRLGAALVVETLERWERGELVPREQDHDAATLAPRLSKDDGHIDWRRSAIEIERQVRAMTPWPGAATSYRGEPLRVLEASLAAYRPTSEGGPMSAGVVLGTAGASLLVRCGRGTLALDRVQRAGRRPLAGREFWNGERLSPGELLGRPATREASA
ncbi:MAG TPA: methionyl-tRNA formyltransferase [Thermoanaerobaculia bacterium]|nr:methionyl-tRNA formyltransferase [Thermoanaerobaculia bacterium]